MKPPLDALTLLRAQHDEADALFAALEEAGGPVRRRTRLAELTTVLMAHMRIEERIFYPSVYSDDLAGDLREANEEHLSIKRVLADLRALAVDDPQFDAKVKVAKEQVEHHAREEEEQQLFPKVAARVSQGRLDALGVDMQRLYDQLIDADASVVSTGELRTAAPL